MYSENFVRELGICNCFSVIRSAEKLEMDDVQNRDWDRDREYRDRIGIFYKRFPLT